MHKNCFAALMCALLLASASAQTPELVKDVNPLLPGSGAFDLTPFNNRLLFFAIDGINGKAPWVTDGTTGGTHILKDVLPSATGGENFDAYWVGDDRAWFWGSDDFDQYTKLYLTDGTSGGTRLVDSLYGLHDVVFNQGWATGDRLQFVWKSPLSDHYVFYQSDGDTITPTGLEEPAVLGGILRLDSFFYQRLVLLPNFQGYKTDLIRSDGTPAGTSTLLENLGVNTSSSTQYANLLDVSGRLGYVFVKWTGPTYVQSLHVEGFPVVTLATGQQFGAKFFNILNDKLLYLAPAYPDSPAAPMALYAFNGLGTEQLMVYEDTLSIHPGLVEQVGSGKLLFRTIEYTPYGPQRIWITDGTAAGTKLLIDPATLPGSNSDTWISPVHLNEAKQEVYFYTTTNQGDKTRFWLLNLVDSTFQPLFDFNSVSPFGANALFVYFNGAIVFTADDGLIGRELWKYQLYPVGVEEETNEVPVAVEVFPNPVVDKLNLRISGAAQQRLQWNLFDALGCTVDRRLIDMTPSVPVEIGVVGLPPGLYFYRVSGADGKWARSGKVLKR